MESKAGKSQTQFQACVERFCSADQLPAKLPLATPNKSNLHTYIHMDICIFTIYIYVNVYVYVYVYVYV